MLLLPMLLAATVTLGAHSVNSPDYLQQSIYCQMMQRNLRAHASTPETHRYLAAASNLCATDLHRLQAPAPAIRAVRAVEYTACEWLDSYLQDTAVYHTIACEAYWNSETHWRTKHPARA